MKKIVFLMTFFLTVLNNNCSEELCKKNVSNNDEFFAIFKMDEDASEHSSFFTSPQSPGTPLEGFFKENQKPDDNHIKAMPIVQNKNVQFSPTPQTIKELRNRYMNASECQSFDSPKQDQSALQEIKKQLYENLHQVAMQEDQNINQREEDNSSLALKEIRKQLIENLQYSNGSVQVRSIPVNSPVLSPIAIMEQPVLTKKIIGFNVSKKN